MSVLDVVQKAMSRTNKPTPTSAVGNNDPLVKHFLALLEELGQETVLRFPSGKLKSTLTWNATGNESQGTLLSRFGDEYPELIEGTFYDVSTKLRILAFSSDITARAAKIIQVNPGVYSYELVGGELKLYPAPPADTPLSVDFYTNNWVRRSSDSSLQTTIVADADTFLLPEPLLILGLRAKWLEEKGLPYAEQKRGFEGMLMSYISTSNTPRTLNLNQGDPLAEARPRVVVPQGPWMIP